MSEQRLAAWRDRRRAPLAFRLTYPDPATGRPTAHDYQLPGKPARAWVMAFLSDDPADLCLDLLEDADADALWEEVRDPDSGVTVDLLHRIGRSLLAAATDRPWWVATRILATLVHDWPTFDALAADAGLGDPLDWTIERLCNWTLHKLTSNQDAEERERILEELTTPPPGLLGTEDEQLIPDTDEAGWVSMMTGLDPGAALDGVARA